MKEKLFVLAVSLILVFTLTSGFAAAIEDPPYPECPPPYGCMITILEPLMGYYSGGILDVSWDYTWQCFAHNYNLNYKLGECTINPSGWTHIHTVGYAENTDFPWDVTDLGDLDPIEECELYCLEVVDENWDPLHPLRGRGTTEFYIDNTAPTVEIIEPIEGVEGNGGCPSEVNFSATVEENCGITNYYWTFGDGGDSTLENPTHQYTDDGNYEVTLTVTDIVGHQGMDTAIAVIVDKTPTADFYWLPDPAKENMPIEFFDNSASCPDEIVYWYWTFGTGDDSEDQNPIYVYYEDGCYNVELTVEDEDGSIDSIIKLVCVEDTPKILDISWDPEYPYEIIESVTFTATVDTTDGICGWHWEFGDGEESFDENPTHIYMNAYESPFEVTLTVTDCNGSDEGAASENIEVMDLMPEACFTGPEHLLEGEPGNFDASCSYHPSDLVSYEWDWENDGFYDESGIATSHSWPVSGDYTVVLKVTDDEGNEDTAEMVVHVHDYVIILHPGLNFVSIPLVPLGDDTSIENVLAPIMDKIDTEKGVWYRDIGFSWKQFIPGLGGTFEDIYPGIGFYLFLDAEETTAWYGDGEKMYQQDTSPYPPEVKLVDGWQMIGHYGLINELSEMESLRSLQTIVYDGDGNPISFLRNYNLPLRNEFGDGKTTTELGAGRWINMRIDNYVGEELWYIPSEEAYNY
ncbi:MAG: PKD domain-containing protein [Nanoarchaeota archaeon]|nr:PKD domain-containing protein [Nanoarchaeota archaeon]MBU2520435.1 PKD domain-containing protein [Nanoarchaeota archaeon]